MQLCKCDVMLGGDRNNVVAKEGVSIAEIVVLRAIHGGDAVVNIRPAGIRSLDHHEELARLKRTYNRREAIVDKVFTGVNPTLPTKFADIGLKYADSIDGKGGANKPKRRTKKPDNNGDVTYNSPDDLPDSNEE